MRCGQEDLNSGKKQVILGRDDCVWEEIGLDGRMVGHRGWLAGDRIRTAWEE